MQVGDNNNGGISRFDALAIRGHALDLLADKQIEALSTDITEKMATGQLMAAHVFITAGLADEVATKTARKAVPAFPQFFVWIDRDHAAGTIAVYVSEHAAPKDKPDTTERTTFN